MQRYFDYFRDSEGVGYPGASVTVYLAGTSTLASLYATQGDLQFPSAINNPTTTDPTGFFGFAVPNGVYDIIISGSGVPTVTRPNITITDLYGTFVPSGVLTVGATAPVVSSGGQNPSISMAAATDTVDGYMTATDHTILTGKAEKTTTIATTTPLQGGGSLAANRTFSILQAGASQDGYLSQADYNNFNSILPILASTSIVSDGDARIGVKQTWTGAAARTQHDRNVEIVLATDASGVFKDGASDSSAGLQAVLTAMAGKHFTIPAGTYKISTGLTVPAGTWIYAYGVILDASAGHITALNFTDGGGIFGVKIKGAGNASYNASGNGVKCSGTNNHPSAPTYVAGPTLRDCTFDLLGSYGCQFLYCTRPVVEYCTFTNIGYCAVDFESCNDQQANYNRIDGVTPGTSGNAYGIGSGRIMNADALGNLTSYPRCKGGSVRGNEIANIPLWEALDTHAGDGIVFSGNRITNCLIGCALVPTHYGAADDYAPINCIIEGNIFDVLYGNTAINISGAYNGTLVNPASSNRVLGNRVNGGGIATDNTYGALRMIGTRDNVVIGNEFENPKVFGICLQQENDNFVISGNTVLDPHDASVTIPSDIAVRGDSNTGYIGGNSFVKRNAALATYVSVNSIYFTNGLTGLKVTVDQNSLIGFAAVGPNIANGGQTGIDLTGCYSETGSSSITLASGGTSNLVDVNFAGTFPIAPKVMPVCKDSPLTGGTGAIFRVTSITTTGFRAIAYSATGGNYTASGAMAFDWSATI